MHNQVVEVLQQARALMTNGWCQDWFVLKGGVAIDIAHMDDNDDDLEFCAEGALYRVGQRMFGAGQMPYPRYSSSMVYHDAREALQAQLKGEGRENVGIIAQYNNSHTKEEVLALFDRAIEAKTIKAAEPTVALDGLMMPEYEAVAA